MAPEENKISHRIVPIRTPETDQESQAINKLGKTGRVKLSTLFLPPQKVIETTAQQSSAAELAVSGEFQILQESPTNPDEDKQPEYLQRLKSRLKLLTETTIPKLPMESFIGKKEIHFVLNRAQSLLEKGIQKANDRNRTLTEIQTNHLCNSVVKIISFSNKAVKIDLKTFGFASISDEAFRLLGFMSAQLEDLHFRKASDFRRFKDLVAIDIEHQSLDEQLLLEFIETILETAHLMSGRTEFNSLFNIIALAGRYSEYLHIVSGRTSIDGFDKEDQEILKSFDIEWARTVVLRCCRNLLDGTDILFLDDPEKERAEQKRLLAEQQEHETDTAKTSSPKRVRTYENLDQISNMAEGSILTQGDILRIKNIKKKLIFLQNQKINQEERKKHLEKTKGEKQTSAQSDSPCDLDAAEKRAKELLGLLILTPKKWKEMSEFEFEKRWKEWFSLMELAFNHQPPKTTLQSKRGTRSITRLTDQKEEARITAKENQVLTEEEKAQDAAEIEKANEETGDIFGDDWL